jgi:hypothetical protein
MIEGTPNESVNRHDVLLTRERLAEALDVSLRTVDLMVMRLRRCGRGEKRCGFICQMCCRS